jgi:hypothetical protein
MKAGGLVKGGEGDSSSGDEGVLISGHWTNYKRCEPDRVKGFWGEKRKLKESYR